MLLPTAALAIDVETEPIILGSDHIENPYGSIIDLSPSVIDNEEGNEKTITVDDMPTVWYTDVQQAADALFTGMKDRESEIMIGVTADVYNTMGGNDAWNTLYSTALAHDPNDPKGGDYTGLLFEKAGGLYGIYGENYYLYYTVTYRTTKEQEDAVDTKVDTLVTAWKTQKLNDYQIIKTIYDYITANVTYDNEGLNDAEDVTKFTAYGALCEGSAVCMGISILFYRLALEMGVDARFIHSIDSENHAWDIVKLGNYYYNIDATWDLGYELDKWFLKNMDDFQVKEDGAACHTRENKYLTDEWMEAYPMTTYSYGRTSNTAQEADRGSIAFEIPHIGVDTTDWKPDCLWEVGEYAEIKVKKSWISAACADSENLNTAMNLPIKLGMSWDEDYIYTFVQFKDPNGHDNTWGSNPVNMWYAGCMQLGYAEADATGTDRLEYGIARTSDTNALISHVWAKDYAPSTDDFNVQVSDNGTMTYEFRTPIDSFSTVTPVAGATYGACYVLSWGNGQDYAHTQLGSGITGDAGKEAANFMKVTLSDTVLEEIPWNTWNNIQWYFDETTGTLTIGGESAIPSVSYSAYPWRSILGKTKVLVFEEGITSVPGIAFSGMYNLTTLSIPKTMQTLVSGNPSLFANAYNLSNITAADGGTYYVQDGVLYTADTLVFYPAGKTDPSYTIPKGIVTIGAYAFPRNSSLTALTLPESLQSIGDNAMTMTELKTLHIPKNVSSIHKYAFVFMDALTAYTVDSENPNYTAVDGILYTKDMTTLMAYPDNHPATTFTVPDTVVEMDPAILHRSKNLKTLTLPASLTTIWTCRSFSGGCDLEEVIVDSANQNFCSVDGVLYSKDMTTLYYYPENKADTEFHIPDSVTTLAHASMFNLRKLNTLYFGSGITTVQMQFSLSLLEKIYFPGDLPSWFSRAFSNLQYYGMLDTLTFYYPAGNTTWTDGTMTISGVTYKTASYTRYTAEDLTGDGKIDADDLSLLLDYFSGKDVTFDLTKADFDGDGVFTRADVMYLARALANWAGYVLKGTN